MSCFLSTSLALLATITLSVDFAGFENKSDRYLTDNTHQSKTEKPICEPCDENQGKGCCADLKKKTT